MSVITQNPSHSSVLAMLQRLLPETPSRLSLANEWGGFCRTDPTGGFTYTKLSSHSTARLQRPLRKYHISIHRFYPQEQTNTLHNHCFPFAVFPFCTEGASHIPLYEMHWHNSTGETGSLIVRSGEPYAMEGTLLSSHAVRPLRPLFSVMIADVTQPAARASRLVDTPLSMSQRENLRIQALNALQLQLRSSGLTQSRQTVTEVVYRHTKSSQSV